MKKVYFVQVSFPFGNSVYLPLAVGVLASNAWSNPQVKSEYELSDFLIFRDSIDDAAAKITEPFLVAFSNYVWNVEYNKALAKRIKQLYPQCLILFGGHAVPQDKDFLLREDYVDFLIFGEGEGPFLQLLLGLLDGGVSSVEALVYKKDGVPVQNAGSGCMKLDELPSPYLDGTFDALIKKHPDTDFLAVIETNRGCPNLCSFCDWCAGRRVRTFPLERVFAEIDKLSEHRIEYCFCADSNFGLLERDKEIVDYLVESKKGRVIRRFSARVTQRIKRTRFLKFAASSTKAAWTRAQQWLTRPSRPRRLKTSTERTSRWSILHRSRQNIMTRE